MFGEEWYFQRTLRTLRTLVNNYIVLDSNQSKSITDKKSNSHEMYVFCVRSLVISIQLIMFKRVFSWVIWFRSLNVCKVQISFNLMTLVGQRSIWLTGQRCVLPIFQRSNCQFFGCLRIIDLETLLSFCDALAYFGLHTNIRHNYLNHDLRRTMRSTHFY